MEKKLHSSVQRTPEEIQEKNQTTKKSSSLTRIDHLNRLDL
jgi:hypothetical protein